MKAKINIIGIGAQKCASTWVYGMLAEHPSVCVSEEKEVNFFSYYYDRGYHWYQQQFESGNTSAYAEVSPSYFCDPNAPQRVYDYNPDAKIILTLRHPVQRALSNHRHEVRVGHANADDTSFEAGLANNPMYIEQSRYAKHLKNWRKVFPTEQMLILLMDDIKLAPAESAKQLFNFIGVDPEFQAATLNKTYNRSFANKHQGLSSVKDRIYMATRSKPLSYIWNAADSLGLKAIYRRINQVDSDTVIPDPLPSTLHDLHRVLHHEITELEQLLQRPLDAWKNE